MSRYGACLDDAIERQSPLLAELEPDFVLAHGLHVAPLHRVDEKRRDWGVPRLLVGPASPLNNGVYCV